MQFKTPFILSTLTIGALFSSVALADEPVYPPCNGNFGITYPQRCTPQQPQPVIIEVPDEAFAPAPDYAPAPPPAPEPAPAPAQGPCYETQAPQPPATPYYKQPYKQPYKSYYPAQAWKDSRSRFGNPERSRELGVRTLAGDGFGGSLYFRTHRNTSQLGLEISYDAVDIAQAAQVSLVGYTKHKGFLQPYGFVGGGLALNSERGSFQAGLGADLVLTPRLSVNADVRYMSIPGNDFFLEDCLDCFFFDDGFEGTVASVGLGWKLGALGTPAASVFQGQPLRSRYQVAQAGYQARYNSQGGLLASRFNNPKGGPNNRVRELGVRSIIDLDFGDMDGGGLYYKTYKDGGRLGVEISADSFTEATLGQAALLGFLNPNGIVRPYGVAGIGMNFENGFPTSEGGFGVDVSLSNRLSINSDLRVISGTGPSAVECFEGGACGEPTFGFTSTIGSVGLSWKY